LVCACGRAAERGLAAAGRREEAGLRVAMRQK